jgi:ribosomal protein S12 methylthiotransferase accessory factor
MSTITLSFPGGVRVDASINGHTVRTDQPIESGGADTAPAPFDLFLASMATCMGFYALRFCQQRNLPTDGLNLTVDPVRSEDGKRVELIRTTLQLPGEFPDKYRDAIVRSVDHCAVKRALHEPPEFELEVVTAELVS